MPTQKELLQNMHDVDARLASERAEKQLAQIAAAVGNKADQKQVPFTKEQPASKSAAKTAATAPAAGSPLGNSGAWSVGDAPQK